MMQWVKQFWRTKEERERDEYMQSHRKVLTATAEALEVCLGPRVTVEYWFRIASLIQEAVRKNHVIIAIRDHQGTSAAHLLCSAGLLWLDRPSADEFKFTPTKLGYDVVSRFKDKGR